jgi:hypothetical protein
MINPSKRETTVSAASTTWGSSTGIPPADSTDTAYRVGNKSAGVSQTRNLACSRYVLRPMTGRVMG